MLCPNPEPPKDLTEKDSKSVHFFCDAGVYRGGSSQLVIPGSLTIKNYTIGCGMFDEDDKDVCHRVFGITLEILCFYVEIYWEWNR